MSPTRNASIASRVRGRGPPTAILPSGECASTGPRMATCTVSAYEPAGTRTQDTAKMTREMGLVVEPGQHRGLRRRPPVHQVPAREIDAAPGEVLVWRKPEPLAERPHQVRGAGLQLGRRL